MKKKKLFSSIFVISVMINTLACDKSNKVGANAITAITDFNQIFEQFWKNMNTSYLYWDIDDTNWDNVYLKYKPLFKNLDINNNKDIQQSALYFKEITKDLIDSHLQITFQAAAINGQLLYPAFERKKSQKQFHSPFDYSNIDIRYFDPNYKIAIDKEATINSNSLKVTLSTIKKKLVYFSCNQFTLQNSYNSSSKNDVKTLLDSFFNIAIKDTSKINGIIIDVRNNFGGNLGDLNFFLSHLINKSIDFGFTRYKSNTGRLDYTPWIKAIIPAGLTNQKVNCPIIVLADSYTVSVAEAVSMAIHLLPNGKIIGENTWGATGPLAAHDVFNAGSFTISNFLTVYTSSAEFKYIDSKSYEGVGFPPDIAVPFSEDSLNKGYDLQLEKAISLLSMPAN